jgi:hypothetical protein
MLFQQEDGEGLRECLGKILLEPSLLNKLKEGIKPVKTMEAHAEEILREYEKLLSRGTEQMIVSDPRLDYSEG